MFSLALASLFAYFVSMSMFPSKDCTHAQSCLTLCNPMDCSPLGSSFHGVFQARILGWVTISSSRESSQLRDQPHFSSIAGRLFITEQLGKPPYSTLNSKSQYLRCFVFAFHRSNASMIHFYSFIYYDLLTSE